MAKYTGSMKGYSLKEFKEELEKLGFHAHHRNSSHIIFVNDNWQYVTVPAGKKKEMNHLMTTVIMQRIKNNNLRILPVNQRNLK